MNELTWHETATEKPPQGTQVLVWWKPSWTVDLACYECDDDEDDGDWIPWRGSNPDEITVYVEPPTHWCMFETPEG